MSSSACNGPADFGQPKSPQPDQQPLQPGGPTTSRSNTADPQRPNHQTTDKKK